MVHREPLDLKMAALILAQYITEASFLWQLRHSAASAPHHSLADLAKLDDRLEAHIDGLRIAGEDGWQLARKEMAWKEPGEVFTAAILAFESGSQSRIAEILNVGAAKPELARGVISALGWMEYEQSEPHIRTLCTSPPRSHRRIGIAAAAIHRRDPGQPLRDALSSGDPLLRARAAKAVGELGRTDLVPHLQADMRSTDPACRFWSAWSTTLLVGYGTAIQLLQSIAAAPGPWRERALHLALRRLNPSAALSWQQELARKPQNARQAVIAAGILGDPVLVPWLLAQMAIPPLARVAGEAFTNITGADLAYLDLNAKPPEDFEPGPNDDPQDHNVEMDPDERLPWPGVPRILQWWHKHQHEFSAGTRYLTGKPISIESAAEVLRTGRQRQRAAAALELALPVPGKPLFEVRAPGFRQQQLLHHAASG
jgi:uncharacterized protein (TIGR02270 family)